MASKTHYNESWWKSPGVHVVAGSFVTAGGAGPTVLTGAGWSVAYAATGVYTVTLADKYPGLIALDVSLTDTSGAAGTGRAFATGTDVAAAGTLTIQTQSSAGTAAALTGPIVNFVAVLRNTTATK